MVVNLSCVDECGAPPSVASPVANRLAVRFVLVIAAQPRID